MEWSKKINSELYDEYYKFQFGVCTVLYSSWMNPVNIIGVGSKFNHFN